MGCDIHIVLEQKLDDQWVGVWSSDKSASGRGKVAERNYSVFTELANVRGSGGMFYPKFIPSDVSQLTVKLIGKFGPDGHSHSYLSTKDFCAAYARGHEKYVNFYKEQLGDRYQASKNDPRPEFMAYDLFGLYDDDETPESRVIFWFDN